MGSNIPVFFQLGTRNILMTLVFGACVFITKNWKTISRSDFGWIAIRSFIGVFGFVFYFQSLNTLSVGTTYLTLYAGSVMGGFFLGKTLFGEKMTKEKIVSLLFAIVGLVIIYGNSVEITSFRYFIVAFFAGIFGGIWNVIVKKVSNTYSALQLNFVDCVLAVPFSLGISLLFSEKWQVPTFTDPWIANVGLGFMYIITGQLIIYGFRFLEASVGSIVLLAEILFAILYGYYFFNEIITPPMIIGGLLIVVAIILPEVHSFAFVYNKERKHVS